MKPGDRLETCPQVCSSSVPDVSWPVPHPPLVSGPLCYLCQGEVLCIYNHAIQFSKCTKFTIISVRREEVPCSITIKIFSSEVLNTHPNESLYFELCSYFRKIFVLKKF